MEIKKKFEPTKTLARKLYMRKIDINKFENYQEMVTNLKPQTNYE
jgi:hypothetical protein